MSPLSEALSIFFVAVAAFLSSVFRSDNLPRQWNIVIAIVALIVCAAGDTWLLIGFTSDIRGDVAVLLVTGVGLGGRELIGLLNYIEGAASPLATLIRPTILQRRSAPPLATMKRPPEQVL